MQCNLTGSDRDGSGLQALFSCNLLLTPLDMFEGNGYMRVKLLSLGGERDSMALPDEQGTTQLVLELFNHACKVGLVVHKNLGGSGKALILGNIIEHTVIVIADIHHKFSYIKIIYLHNKTDILHISFVEL